MHGEVCVLRADAFSAFCFEDSFCSSLFFLFWLDGRGIGIGLGLELELSGSNSGTFVILGDYVNGLSQARWSEIEKKEGTMTQRQCCLCFFLSALPVSSAFLGSPSSIVRRTHYFEGGRSLSKLNDKPTSFFEEKIAMENFDLPFSADDAGRIYESVSASLSSVESKLGQVVREVRVGIADGLSAGDNGPLLKSYGDIKGAVEFQLADARSALDQATASINPADIVPSEAAPKLVDALSPAFGALAALPTSLQFGAGLVASFFIFNSLLGGPPLDSPYPAGVYDARTATQYFRTRPLTQLIRVAEIMFLSSSFLFSVYVLDKLFSSPENAEELEEKRGVELADLLTVLGPTFIKVGQSLSIRTDLVQASYAKGLTQLQDKVPPFNSEEAFKILSAQFNKPVDEVFSTITPEPIASASLGQVYKATMRESGQEVAVKIQRPRSVEKIALDMHLVRTFAAPLKAAFNINTDLVGTVDAWGGGFVDELDYLKESENAKVFNEAIKTTTLSNVVFAPAPLDSYCTTNILTTEWIDGERLDKSSKDDVSSLCSVAMNTYLAMMLELGVLHCDPHPGNLLRTPEGKLCILDWGLVTSLSSDLQITLIEHVAHLTSGDYAEVPEDLVLLGFVPEKMVERMKEAKIVETLADIYGTWSMGGGANRIDVNSVVNDIRGLTAKGEGSIFQVPPYFFYIGKAFSVLEGIGLQNDENYSVINACLPYISKRLLQDKSDRMAGALDSFIFGEGKNSRDRVIDVDRMGQLVTGFGDYSATSSNELTSSRSQILEDQAEQLIEIVLTDDRWVLSAARLEESDGSHNIT